MSLPSLRETSVAERGELFRKKLAACSMVFDFNSDTMGKEKELKRLEAQVSRYHYPLVGQKKRE